MKKQFILSVIISMTMLFTVNGQSLENLQSRFSKKINNHEKVEPKQPELSNLASIKSKNINQRSKHLSTDIYTQRLDSIVYKHYDDVLMQLVNQAIEVYTYDANNNMISEIYSYWDNSINDWVVSEKYEYNYDVDNNMISVIYCYWDTGINDWVVSGKYEYTYDANNNMISEIYSYWDNSINDWIFSAKYEFSYDANNNMISEIYSAWDNSINDWKFYEKYEFTYDLGVNITAIVAPEWYYNFLESPCYNKLLTYTYYVWDGADFISKGIATFYYSDIVGINEAIDNSFLTIYPNPANDYLMINTQSINNDEIQIFNAFGQNVMIVESLHNVPQQRIDISQLPAGIYFIRISNDVNNITKKIIKQ